MKDNKKGQFLLVVPVLVLPFLTLLFWSLGGGRGVVDERHASRGGFNSNLPKGGNDDHNLDKMAFYRQAQADSAKRLQEIQNDPSYSYPDQQLGTYSSTGINSSLYGAGRLNDPYVGQLHSQLQQAEWEIGNGGRQQFGQLPLYNPQMEQMEQMMNALNQPQPEDPEMKQLNGMLENILDLQYPDRIAQRQKEMSRAKRGQVYAVATAVEPSNSTLLQSTGEDQGEANGFFSLDDARGSIEQNAIRAVVAETQTLVNGSTVKMRLLNDIFINGVHIPRDNFIYGVASLQGERLEIEINSIRFRNSLFPVQLAVYDLDGLNGVLIPGAITRDVAKESTDRSLQNIGIGSLDPSLGAQAASAGIEAAKSLIGRKVKLVRVVVKAGYQILLRDEKQKEY